MQTRRPSVPVSIQTWTALQMLEYMTAQNEAWPFREPVKAEEVPDYYTLVKVLANIAPPTCP